MKTLAITLLIAGLMSETSAFAKHSKVSPRMADQRAQRARRQIAEDLRLRGSNVPAAYSASGKWAR